jgi:hypothetical protein
MLNYMGTNYEGDFAEHPLTYRIRLTFSRPPHPSRWRYAAKQLIVFSDGRNLFPDPTTLAKVILVLEFGLRPKYKF